MRHVKLSGREASVVRLLGFEGGLLGSELLDGCHMEIDDLTDTLNSLLSAGLIETVPYTEQVDIAHVPVTAFEINAGYATELRRALSRY